MWNAVETFNTARSAAGYQSEAGFKTGLVSHYLVQAFMQGLEYNAKMMEGEIKRDSWDVIKQKTADFIKDKTF